MLMVGAYLAPRGYPMRVLCLILLAASLAQSWNIVGGLANQLSLGHAAYFGIGAYTSTILFIQFGLSPWLGMPAGMGLAALAALLLSRPTMGLRGPYFALASLAFAEACRIVANTLSITGGPQGLSVPFVAGGSASPLWAMQFRAAGSFLPLLVGLFAVVFTVFALLSTSRIGLMLRALRENEAASEVAGIDTLRIKLVVAVISAVLAAACGTFYAQFNFFFDPDTVFSATNVSIRMALIAIVGGVGTLAGPLLGALIVLPVEEWLIGHFSDNAAGVAPFLFGTLLVVLVLVRPYGLISLPGLRLLARGPR
jgi:branched-chain amino acid transport system permease protein